MVTKLKEVRSFKSTPLASNKRLDGYRKIPPSLASTGFLVSQKISVEVNPLHFKLHSSAGTNIAEVVMVE
jgi:hypothetical protein